MVTNVRRLIQHDHLDVVLGGITSSMRKVIHVLNGYARMLVARRNGAWKATLQIAHVHRCRNGNSES